MWYSQKLVISGDFIEHYQYQRAIEEGYERGDEFKKKGRESCASELERFENRKKVMQRARSKIRRVINSNVGRWYDERGSPIEPKFFTMTYADNITDIKYSNNEFEKYIKRLKRALKKPIKYLAVIEFQKRGAIHYHVICGVPH